jgi:hypothetical protein
MPSHYAHYYFGKEVIKRLPEDIKNIINSGADSLDAFIIGLQGPDILAFYRPYSPNSVGKEGRMIHRTSGANHFYHILRYVRENPDNDNLSYLYGCLGHYILDSACHPIVSKQMRITGLTHAKVEREFDSYLLRKSGKDPIGYPLSAVIPVNRNLGDIIAPFYRSLNPRRANEAILSMRKSLEIFSSPSVNKRKAAYAVLSSIPVVRSKRDMVALKKPDIRLTRACSELESALNTSVGTMLGALETINKSIEDMSPLDAAFKPDYLGKIRD